MLKEFAAPGMQVSINEKNKTNKNTSDSEDIVKFIPDPTVLDIWSAAYFHDLVKKINIQ